MLLGTLDCYPHWPVRVPHSSLPHSLQESIKISLSSALSEEKETAATLRKEVDLNRTGFDCIMLMVQGLGVTALSNEEEEEEASPCGKEQSGRVVVGGNSATLGRGKRPVWIAGSVSGWLEYVRR